MRLNCPARIKPYRAVNLTIVWGYRAVAYFPNHTLFSNTTCAILNIINHRLKQIRSKGHLAYWNQIARQLDIIDLPE